MKYELGKKVNEMNLRNIEIDKEFEELLPPLFSEDRELLKESLEANGFDAKFAKIKVWFPAEADVGYIVDGHNRYAICKELGLNLDQECFEEVKFDSREDVIEWIYENQLARRNLSDVDKYEIVERFSSHLQEMAKRNQSAGGKGLSNLTKVNSRKEKASRAGISEGNYYKLNKIMQSDDDVLKSKLRNNQISINKGYEELMKNKPTTATPAQQLYKIDRKISEINKQIESYLNEKKDWLQKRSNLFYVLDIDLELKYEVVTSVLHGRRICNFFVEYQEHKEIYVEEAYVSNEYPDGLHLQRIPEKYRIDFQMLWKHAYEEAKKYEEEQEKCWKSYINKADEEEKSFYKQCYRALAKCVHPDNAETDGEAMKCLNQLKVIWGI